MTPNVRRKSSFQDRATTSPPSASGNPDVLSWRLIGQALRSLGQIRMLFEKIGSILKERIARGLTLGVLFLPTSSQVIMELDPLAPSITAFRSGTSVHLQASAFWGPLIVLCGLLELADGLSISFSLFFRLFLVSPKSSLVGRAILQISGCLSD
ncbi:hypothetical protein GALMADRAFT_632478 [Galerina marginata CBS 339.88]|uniref:Uncharacterized protein n=1 Tax=Galerina marginata (strain CBS 339.88) TaxID=685588 RepID=A0A067SSC4_GALM3|nr:hypothetical protein GALMADRAFT_632478 [Galerina marginata CBS 339.88]